jgi:hypothetical protein
MRVKSWLGCVVVIAAAADDPYGFDRCDFPRHRRRVEAEWGGFLAQARRRVDVRM